MQTNVLDLIIKMVRMLRLGENLKEMQPELLKKYNKSEVSAAYSWVIQKIQDGDLTREGTTKNKDLRVLHTAERMVISTEAYGYLIELYNMGILNFHQMEAIIEQTMMNNFDKISLDKMKAMAHAQIFGKGKKSNIGSIYLSGNETVN